MFIRNTVALFVAFAMAACSAIVPEVGGVERWSVEPSPVEDVDLARIVAELPAAVACVRENDPAKCGIDADDYLVESIDAHKRTELFSDGPIVIDFESWNDDDNVKVTFVGGKGVGASGVMRFRRRGSTFVLRAVGILIVD